METPSSAPEVTVVITTRNRREELSRALRSALVQVPPVDVLVLDDGSTDGTPDMVRAEFPAVRLERRETSAGYIVRRNEAARLARTPFLVSIDDDAEFSSSRVVAQARSEFDHERIGAVAIPFVNVLQGPQVFQQAPDSRAIHVAADYIGTAHALRRDVFLRLGGYREHFIHQGEERDYCVRMLAAGYVVRLGRVDAIHHYESPRRDLGRMDHYGRRNDVLFAWHNVPTIHLAIHLAATTVNGLRAGVRVGRTGKMLRGLVAGYGAILRARRQPVPVSVYWLQRRLRKGGARPLTEIEAFLPPLPPP